MEFKSAFAHGSTLALAALLASGCTSTTPTDGENHPAANEVKTSELAKVEADVVAAIDTSINPCDDFYQFACGGWLASTELPGDQPTWGRSFNEIWQKNQKVLKTILEEEAPKATGDAGLTQLGDFYQSCMAEDTIEAAGTTVLDPWLKKIEGIVDGKTLMAALAEMHVVDVDGLFGAYVAPGLNTPDIYVLSVIQSGLGLPDRDYYLVDDERMQSIRVAYQTHLTTVFAQLGHDEAASGAMAQSVIAFETQLAELAMPRIELRNPENRDNMMSYADFSASTPSLDWDTYFAAIGMEGQGELNVVTVDYLKGLSELMAKADYSVIRTYLAWHLVDANAGLLPSAIDESDFKFFGQTLQGRKVQQERWKRCVSSVGWSLGDGLAKYFVDREFPGDSKAKSAAMIKGIEAAFEKSLPGLTWMDDVTRGRAVEKMESISNKIGYPDTWKDYSAVEVAADTYFSNVLNARRVESERILGRIAQKVDKSEWFMPSFIVNAYYNPSANEIVFPAGILQAPFFDREFPAAMNFGAIGVVMGHELTHGFDDSGRKFDGSGQLVEWWEPEVSERFEEAAQCVVEQYSSYEVSEGLKVNGELTLGENIADLGGVNQAFAAYKNYTAENGGLDDGLGGYSQDQLFFLAYAQSWCTLATPEIEEMRVLTDPHSPPRFRVNGSVANSRDFGKAFQCEIGTPMQPKEICSVW